MFGFLQSLTSSFYGSNSTIEDVDGINNSSSNPINTTIEDVDGINNSSFNPINTRAERAESIIQSDESSQPLQSTATDLLNELRLYWSTIDDVMKPDDVHSGWSMIETLATVSVSKASLMERHGALLLASAIMRIALDIFASRGQLENPLNSETIELLLFKKIRL